MMIGNRCYKKVFIVTSDDFGFAGWVALKLLKSGHDVVLVNKREKKSSFAKKVALSLAFGCGVIEYFARVFWVKTAARRIVVKINSISDLYKLYSKESSDSLFLMINFDEIIKCVGLYDKSNFLNFHPSLLPSYKGLGPIFWCFFDNLKNNHMSFGWTVHKINQHVDRGEIVANLNVSVDLNKSLWHAYKSVYSDVGFLKFIKFYCENGERIIASTKSGLSTLYGAPTFEVVLQFLALKHFMLFKYLKFSINGGIIGLFSWFLQLCLMYIYELLLGVNNLAYALSIYTAFALAMIVNFFSQKKFVFQRNAKFYIFVFVSLCAITLVNLISLLMINYCEIDGISKIAYPVAAIMISPLVFLMKNKFVFR